MRISSQQIFDAGVQALQKQTGDVVEYQRQISSGQRYSKASESPLAAGLGVQVSMKRAVFTMYKINQDQVNASLTSTDTQLSTLQNMLARFQQMTVQAANDAIGEEGRVQLGYQADVLLKSVDKFASALDANGQPILKREAVSQVLVAPTIELDSALTYGEVMGLDAPGGAAVSGKVDVLQVLTNIKNTLTTNKTAPLAADIANLQLALQQVTKAQAKTGVLQNELDAAVQAAEAQKTNTEANRTSLMDTDLGQAAAGLARANALLQAVQTVMSGMDTNSLFKKL
jgi:flagellin-like hook-associated protein FlgL